MCVAGVRLCARPIWQYALPLQAARKGSHVAAAVPPRSFFGVPDLAVELYALPLPICHYLMLHQIVAFDDAPKLPFLSVGVKFALCGTSTFW